MSLDNLRKLTEKLNTLSHAYYVLDAPLTSDKEYDLLFDQLKALEEEMGVVLPDSPTKRVGGQPLKGFEKHNHMTRLLSLDKAQNYGELENWFKDKNGEKFSLEYKFDGITISLTYDNGEFQRATTRGNGTTGEDVTNQVLTIKTYPLTISYKGKMEIIGEAIINLSDLAKFNETKDIKLKNARNAAAGAIRNLDPKLTAQRNPKIIFYSINFMEEEFLKSQEEVISFLQKEGFKTSDLFFVSNEKAQLIKKIEEIELNRSKLDFLIDGAVLKINDFDRRKELGSTDRFPRWALAYKFEAEEAETILKSVKWQVGRTGKVTPLALLAPVELCGVTVSKATLNNHSNILEKKVKLGDLVLVRRSNDVIPEILGTKETFANSTPIEKIEICPSCGSQLFEIGANMFCLSPHCREKTVSKFQHFASKNAMNIDGLSIKTAELLFDEFGLKEEEELYGLTTEMLLTLDGFKEKKVDNLMKALEKSKDVNLSNFIFALGIPGIGIKTAKDLAKTFGCLENIKHATKEMLEEIDDIGEIMANGVVLFFQENKEKLLNLEKILTIKSPDTKGNSMGKFSSEKCVVTGTLSSMKRSEAHRLIEEEGGEISTTITKDVTILIVGEGGGSKLDKAKKLGIKTMDETEFLSILRS